MKLDTPINQLECGTFAPRHHFQRQPDPVKWQIAPVHAVPQGFVLPEALAQHGLLLQPAKGSWQDQAAAKWNRSVDAFLSDLEKQGITRRSVEARGLGARRVMVGWTYEPHKMSLPLRICPDIELTLAILSRCVNQIFFKSRQPDFGWDVLFGKSLVVDEDLHDLIPA